MKFLLVSKRYSSFEVDVPDWADHETITRLVQEALEHPSPDEADIQLGASTEGTVKFTEQDDLDEVYSLLGEDELVGEQYV